MSRVGVVTGGLSGIGRACAVALAQTGHRVAVGSRRGGAGDFDYCAELDVADQGSVDRFFTEVRRELGTPQILINAAGIYHEAFLEGHSDQMWDDQIETNLTGCFRTIRAVYPDMKAQGWGRIVNIASTAAHVGAGGYAGYCASKAGLVGLSRAVAVEGATHGITCVSVSPTWVETPMMDRATERHAQADMSDPATAKAALKESNPQGRLVQPEEIAAVVMLAVSDAAPALTNEDIQVNAGAMW